MGELRDLFCVSNRTGYSLLGFLSGVGCGGDGKGRGRGWEVEGEVYRVGREMEIHMFEHKSAKSFFIKC